MKLYDNTPAALRWIGSFRLYSVCPLKSVSESSWGLLGRHWEFLGWPWGLLGGTWGSWGGLGAPGGAGLVSFASSKPAKLNFSAILQHWCLSGGLPRAHKWWEKLMNFVVFLATYVSLKKTWFCCCKMCIYVCCFYDFEPIAINVVIPYVFWWFRAEKGSMGRQKWDPGEKNIKIRIVL